MRLRASMCAAPQPDRIDGNTSIEMSGVRLLPGPQPERSRINGNTALVCIIRGPELVVDLHSNNE